MIEFLSQMMLVFGAPYMIYIIRSRSIRRVFMNETTRCNNPLHRAAAPRHATLESMVNVYNAWIFAGALVCAMWIFPVLGLTGWVGLFVTLVLATTSLGLVSRWRYRKLKAMDLL